jgi:heat shock protein HslJ
MACAPEAMKLERGLVGALSRTVRIVGAGGDLIFVDARGDRLARFRSISARIIPR